MEFNKTINMCIFEGNPNGRIMCELSNWNGRVYKIARNELNKFSNREDLNNTGIYFLIGTNEDLRDTIYIGEAEKIIERIKQHVNEKEIWNDCIVVISKDNNLNKAHVKYLENKFYNLSLDINKFKVINKNEPTCSSISEYDEAMLQEFIENTKLLVNTLGIKAFSKAIDSKKNKDDNYKLYIKGPRGANAVGTIVSEGFVVFKNSYIADNVVPSFKDGSLKLRQKLIENGVINKEYSFTSDYIFSSPSQAAGIVLGRSANGKTEWKDNNGKYLKDI